MPSNQSVDLHVHSSYSDGSLTPRELAARAIRNNVVALAITDHDTLEGAGEKTDACAAAGLECIPGVELSCEFEGNETHIISLFANPESDWTRRLGELAAARENRMQAMLDRLAGMGIRLDLADIPSDSGTMGRPHLARALVAKGVVKTVAEAFGRYLYDEGPVHIAKTRLVAAEGIDLAKRLGGAAILAHPGVSGLADDLDAFRAMGMDGFEVYHPKQGSGTTASILRYCRSHHLLVSGGSDFHAPGESRDIGSQRVPGDLLEPLRERAASHRRPTLA